MTSIGSVNLNQNNLPNTKMAANMPAPGVSNTEKTPEAPAPAAVKNEVINDSFAYSEAPLNIGVLDGPSTYSKTPISDEIQRRAESSPREKLPQTTKTVKQKQQSKAALNNNVSNKNQTPSYNSKNKKSGNLSAILGAASMALIFSMTVFGGIFKLIKHK